MAEYIEKKAVKDEIERCLADLPETIKPDDVRALMYAKERGLWDAFLHFINSLPTREVKPEVDIEAEFKKWWDSTSGKINIEHSMYWYMKDCARHFAEWGKENK